MLLVHDADGSIAEWVRTRISHVEAWGPSHAIGVVLDGRLAAAAVYSRWEPPGVEMSFAMENPRWATKGALRALLSYPFVALKCARITATVVAGERVAEQFCERVGFVKEGRLRRAAPGGGDIVVFGMLFEEYERKWVREALQRCRTRGS